MQDFYPAVHQAGGNLRIHLTSCVDGVLDNPDVPWLQNSGDTLFCKASQDVVNFSFSLPAGKHLFASSIPRTNQAGHCMCEAGEVGRSTAISFAAGRNRKNPCIRHPCRVRLTWLAGPHVEVSDSPPPSLNVVAISQAAHAPASGVTPPRALRRAQSSAKSATSSQPGSIQVQCERLG